MARIGKSYLVRVLEVFAICFKMVSSINILFRHYTDTVLFPRWGWWLMINDFGRHSYVGIERHPVSFVAADFLCEDNKTMSGRKHQAVFVFQQPRVSEIRLFWISMGISRVDFDWKALLGYVEILSWGLTRAILKLMPLRNLDAFGWLTRLGANGGLRMTLNQKSEHSQQSRKSTW